MLLLITRGLEGMRRFFLNRMLETTSIVRGLAVDPVTPVNGEISTLISYYIVYYIVN